MLSHFVDRRCPVCDSPYVFHLRDVVTKRTRKEIPLYACLRCRSFSNPSGFHEDDAFLHAALEWHLRVHDRNRQYSTSLFTNLKPHIPRLTSVLEIGCGTGTLLQVAREWGAERTLGFDLNRLAIEYGRKEFGLDLSAEVWDALKIPARYDLVLCISVMEHLEQPRHLFREISTYCRIHQASAFISVPFFDEDSWHFLHNPDPSLEKSLFFDNDCHVTHFSRDGFLRLCREFGSTSEIPVYGGAWRGYVIRYAS